MFNTELGRIQCTVMPFGATEDGYVFQQKLDEGIGKLKQIITITDDIMVVGYKQTTVVMTKPSLTCYKQPRSAMSS